MPATITLPAELVIDQAMSIATAWRDIVETAKDRLVVDGAATERADIAGIQLLLALAKEAQARNLPLEIRAPSSRLQMMLKTMGTGDRFTFRDEG